MVSQALEALDGFKFGCDPELFIFDGNMKPVSAAGIIPGTKEEPYKVSKGAVQRDGMAAEFNIDPATSFEEFDDNIATVMRELKKFLPKDYSLQALPSVVFSEEEWDKTPDDAKELGCSPDFDAWTGGVNPPPHDPENPRLRTAAGHLHIGWTEGAEGSDIQHIMNCRDLVKQFDWFLGGWSVKQDPDATRRRLYGKAGACRYKPYGVEYRVLSNFWVTSKDSRRQVWNRMQRAIHAMRSMYLPDNKNVKRYQFNDTLVKSINESNLDINLSKTFRFPLLTEDASFIRF